MGAIAIALKALLDADVPRDIIIRDIGRMEEAMILSPQANSSQNSEAAISSGRQRCDANGRVSDQLGRLNPPIPSMLFNDREIGSQVTKGYHLLPES